MPDRAYLDLYVSWGTDARGGVVKGRVFEGERPELGDTSAGWIRRIWNTYELVETDELEDLEVEVELAGIGTFRVRSNHEGFFEAPFGPATPGSFRVRARLTSADWQHDPVENWLHVYSDQTGLAVISDIDDTVLISGVTRKLEFLKRLILSTPHDLETYPGAASLFQQFNRAGMPCFFVSGSPWNIEPRLRAFFDHRGFPPLPMQLKDMGIESDADALMEQVGYKIREIREIMAALPGRRFILLGDSGQQDPEIYAQIQKEQPTRVAAICIVRVTDEAPDSLRFVGQQLCFSYADVATHLKKFLTSDLQPGTFPL